MTFETKVNKLDLLYTHEVCQSDSPRLHIDKYMTGKTIGNSKSYSFILLQSYLFALLFCKNNPENNDVATKVCLSVHLIAVFVDTSPTKIDTT